MKKVQIHKELQYQFAFIVFVNGLPEVDKQCSIQSKPSLFSLKPNDKT